MMNRYKRWGMLSFVLAIGMILPISAQTVADMTGGYSVMQQDRSFSLLDKTVTVRSAEGSLEEVLRGIEESAGVTFVYRQELVEPFDDVKIERDMTTTMDFVLRQLFHDLPLSYMASEEYIVITHLEDSMEIAAPDTVRGVVRDESSGETLPGVNVMITGTSLGTSTDGDGSYELLVQSLQDTLQFSYIGYDLAVIPLNGRNELNVQLRQATSVLSEVVVTGIFERDGESFTGSHSSVGGERLMRASTDNVIDALRNLEPSMMVMDNLIQGSDPNALPEIQLRGTSTFPDRVDDVDSGLRANFLSQPNEPLFILDGFESSVEEVFDLDMNRVESVTILKDASAKALYGSRASNGVVVIETQKLYATQPVITYNSNLGIELPDLSSYNLANAMEKIEAERIDGMYDPNFNDADDKIALQQLYQSRMRLARQGLDTDWMAKPLRNGISQEHSLSAEIGTEDLKILGGISFSDNQGVMKGSSRQNLSGNVNVSYRVGSVQLRNSMRVTKNNSVNSPYGTFSDYARMNPYWIAENPDGTIPYYAEEGPSGERFTNPLYNSTLNSLSESEYLNFVNNFYLEWFMTPELQTTARFGINTRTTSADEYFPAGHTMFENYVGSEMMNRRGTYQLNNGERSQVSGDVNMRYSTQVNKHFYLVNAGFNVREDQYSELVHRVEGFPSDRLQNPTFGRSYVLDSSPTGIEGINRELGFLGIGSYMYDERYLADATIRTNASSQFGSDRRWARFWSAGLGWNIHNESFMENVSWLSQLKLRGSMGSTGNQNFNTNASVGTYNYYLDSNYNGFLGSYVNNLSNPGLQWETMFDYNAGVDAEIGNLTLRFDYYESYTENLVTRLSVPSSTGFSTVNENIGKIKNSGIEVNTSYLAWRGHNGFFSLNFSIATNTNEIIELSDAMRNYNRAIEEQAARQNNSMPMVKYEDGRSMNAIWAVPSMGIDPATGNEIYIDRFGNLTYEYDPRDMQVVGDDMPKFRGNFGFNGEYRGVGAGVIFRYLGGGQIYNQTLVDKVENVDMNYNVDRRVLTGRWQEPGQEADFKRLGTYCEDPDGTNVCQSVQARTRPTSRFVQDLDQLDIASINVYYNFSPQTLDALGVTRLRLSFNMNEVATFSSVRVERGTSYPFARRMTFSLSATF
jgi:TonB-linked SusC/RagA family outer membrane protein